MEPYEQEELQRVLLGDSRELRLPAWLRHRLNVLRAEVERLAESEKVLEATIEQARALIAELEKRAP